MIHDRNGIFAVKILRLEILMPFLMQLYGQEKLEVGLEIQKMSRIKIQKDIKIMTMYLPATMMKFRSKYQKQSSK